MPFDRRNRSRPRTRRPERLEPRFLLDAGSLDLSFGVGGRVITPLGTPDESSYAMAVQSDGMIVQAGTRGNTAIGGDYIVIRYDPMGNLDPSFGNGGMVETPLGGVVNDIAIASDGKILVGGDLGGFSTGADFMLVRYLPDGTLDASFDGDGVVTTIISGGDDPGRRVAIQPDGKILLAGPSGAETKVARYNVDGSLDTSFATDGIATIGGANGASGIALQSDGRIVLVGQSTAASDFSILRLNSDGSLDTSFGGDGLVTFNTAAGGTDFATNVALQADGKIIAVGTSRVASGNFDICVLRLNSDGSLDTGFDGDGIVTTDISAIDSALSDLDYPHDVVLQANGKILVVGESRLFGSTEFTAIRYNVDGSLDTSFGGDGKAVTRVGNFSDVARSVALQPDGRILVAGYCNNGSSTVADWDFCLARFEAEATSRAPAVVAVTMLGSVNPLRPFNAWLGGGEQLRTVPVGLIDTISIAFHKGVVVEQDDLTVSGLAHGAYSFDSFSYNPNDWRATWTLAEPLRGDVVTLTLADSLTDSSGTPLDGEWDNPLDLADATGSTYSGDGLPGGDFVFRLTVLPGDADRDNQVTGADFTIWADHFDGGQGDPGKVFADGDWNGDGHVNGADYTLLADHFGMDLTGPSDSRQTAPDRPAESRARSAVFDQMSREADDVFARREQIAPAARQPLASTLARKPSLVRRDFAPLSLAAPTLLH